MVGEPITTFLRLPPPPPTPAPADVALSYAINPVEQISTGGTDAVVAAALAPGVQPAVFAADKSSVRRLGTGASTVGSFPGGRLAPFAARSPRRGLELGLPDGFRLRRRSGGLKIYLQKEDGTFADVTAATGSSAGVLSAGYFGVWAADIEMDGDLDFVLGPSGNDKVTVLRNNGDGTFAVVQPFRRRHRPARLRLGRPRPGRRPGRRIAGRQRNCPFLRERARRPVPASTAARGAGCGRRPGRRRRAWRRQDRPVCAAGRRTDRAR